MAGWLASACMRRVHLPFEKLLFSLSIYLEKVLLTPAEYKVFEFIIIIILFIITTKNLFCFLFAL